MSQQPSDIFASRSHIVVREKAAMYVNASVRPFSNTENLIPGECD